MRLRDEKVKIIDVAYDCGFESVDGFQREPFEFIFWECDLKIDQYGIIRIPMV